VAVKVAPGSGPARAAIEVGRQRAILRVQGFPGPGRHRVYQVWVQPTKSSKPIPTGELFTVGRDGRGEVQLPASARRAHAVYVSSEPEGGNRTGAPSRAPVISGSL
jgi:hypothetical protein